MKKIFILLAFVGTAITVTAQSTISPNGRIKAEKHDKHFTVSYKQNGKWMEIYTAKMEGINGGSTRNIKEDYQMLSGKKLHCTNKGKETVYSLQSGGVLRIRVYNDGVAFQKVGRESTGDQAETDVNITIPHYENTWIMNWTDGAEGFYPKNRSLKAGDRLSYPALFEFPNQVFALLTEADIRHDQAASSFYSVDGKNEFNIKHDQNDQTAQQSSWKIMMIGSLADMVESTLVTDLSTPCKLTDTSWIEPGVVSWVYWAYNHGSNDMNIIRKYVDFAATLHLPYVLIDAEWDEMKDGKSVVDAVNYAKEKGVKPMIWYNSSVGWVNGAPGPKYRLNKPEDREKEFAWCEKIGVAGVKVDFFSGDNNMNMAYCIDLMECAARHHLTINFHGATLPRGWQRTYPNLLSTEGVYGAEWYNNVPTFTDKAACHNATLPFTRNVIGSMDYTPCAFSDSQHPHITSHAHELALTALYESGLQHLADRPESFLAQPQEVQDYLSGLPTVWDETRFISGYPGESAVLARRNGQTWYIAGINGTDEEKTLDVTSFRIKGKHSVTIFEDSGQKESPWDIRTVTSLPQYVTCQPRGGFVWVVKELK
jgi:hypothetical protein